MKLLIIEDSSRLRSTLYEGFHRLGYAVDTSSDGKEGFGFALINEYDAIILDLMLPSMDGLEILSRLRQENIMTNILILSAKGQVEDRIRGLSIGADDYLAKPFSFDELHARLLTLMRRKHGIKSPVIIHGDVIVDTSMRLVTIKGNSLILTPKEYQIIEYLFINVGRIVSYEMLGNQLYSSAEHFTRNKLEVHVSTLRRKIIDAGFDDIIRTKRGFGYYIEKQ